MQAGKRRRNDPRREATRTALIEAAESLFAEAGVEGASVRQIGAAIGSSNTNVVAYHFGGKDELIREVYRYRLPEIDRRRSELLDEADEAGRGNDLAALMRAFFQPLFEQTDNAGRHSYARFIAGQERSGRIAARGELNEEFPETERLSDRILACLPESVAPLFRQRQRLAVGLVSSALLQIDQEAGSDPERAGFLFEDAVLMATAAMVAPVPGNAKGNYPWERIDR